MSSPPLCGASSQRRINAGSLSRLNTGSVSLSDPSGPKSIPLKPMALNPSLEKAAPWSLPGVISPSSSSWRAAEIK